MTNQHLIDTIIEGIHDRKGRGVTHIDLTEIPSSGASHFVICEGTSMQHAASVADRLIEYVIDNAGVRPFNFHSPRNSEWIVIDYGDTFVHIFAPGTRSHYNLEELWSDAPRTDVPDLD